jgi:hypothetical protein
MLTGERLYSLPFYHLAGLSPFDFKDFTLFLLKLFECNQSANRGHKVLEQLQVRGKIGQYADKFGANTVWKQ